MNSLVAIILAGGRARRMGRDKATIRWGGETAVQRVARLARDAGAAEILVSGGDYGLPFAPDPIAHGGPVGGLLATAALRPLGDRFLVLAVDAPTLLASDLEPLLTAAGPGAAYAGFPLPMVVARAAMPWDLDDGAPLRGLVDAAGLTSLPPPTTLVPRLRGANTPQDLTTLRAVARQDAS